MYDNYYTYLLRTDKSAGDITESLLTVYDAKYIGVIYFPILPISDNI